MPHKDSKGRNKNLEEFTQKKEVADRTWDRLMTEMSEDTSQRKIEALKNTVKNS
tara:strand:+ start:1675 stop:1836 length:162 start_codon:yes stop_codon:yes gene_type:complete